MNQDAIIGLAEIDIKSYRDKEPPDRYVSSSSLTTHEMADFPLRPHHT